ncbi:TolC family protein [bacterium]|nr:TolC family protein [bacterium]
MKLKAGASPSVKAALAALFAAAALLAALPGAAAAQTDTLRVTLAEMLQSAGQANPMLRAARNAAEAAEGQRLASLAGFLPHLSMSEMFSRSNDPVYAFGTKLRQSIFSERDFAMSALNFPAPISNYSTRFVLQQPIFNGGRAWNGRRMADSYSQAAQKAAGYTAEETAFQVRKAYYSALLARESVVVLDAALTAARSHKHQAERMSAEGLATRADELKASVRVAELEQKRIAAANSVTVAGEYLKLASGVHDNRPVLPLDSLDAAAFNAPLDSLIAFALASHGQLAAADQAAQAAGYGAKAALGSLIPSLNGFAQYERDSQDAFGKDGDNWMVGVSLDWNFFDGLGSVGNVKSARAMREKALNEAAMLRHKVEVDVREAWLNLQAAGKQIEVARGARDEAGESLRIVENQYREGLASITDLLDTEAAATGAGLNYSAALYEYNLSLAGLRLATGGYPIND